MNELIKNSPYALKSVQAVLDHAGIDASNMSIDEMIDKSRSITAPCRHNFDRPYSGYGTRICKNCGALQDN